MKLYWIIYVSIHDEDGSLNADVKYELQDYSCSNKSTSANKCVILQLFHFQRRIICRQDSKRKPP